MALSNHIFIFISLILAMILDTLEVFVVIKWIWPAWYLLFCLIWLTNEKYPTSLWLLWAVSIIFDLTFYQVLGQTGMQLLCIAFILHTVRPHWNSKYSTANKFNLIWILATVYLWIELIVQHSISYLISWDSVVCITRALSIATIWLWIYIQFLRQEAYISLS